MELNPEVLSKLKLFHDGTQRDITCVFRVTIHAILPGATCAPATESETSISLSDTEPESHCTCESPRFMNIQKY